MRTVTRWSSSIVARLSATTARACLGVVFVLGVGTSLAPRGFAAETWDFAGTYRVAAVYPASNGTSRISLIVNLRNVSSGAFSKATLELDGVPPAPLAQTFPDPFSIASHAAIVLTGSFVVRNEDVQGWRSASGPLPALVVVGSDAGGTIGRHGVNLVRNTGRQP